MPPADAVALLLAVSLAAAAGVASAAGADAGAEAGVADGVAMMAACRDGCPLPLPSPLPLPAAAAGAQRVSSSSKRSGISAAIRQGQRQSDAQVSVLVSYTRCACRYRRCRDVAGARKAKRSLGVGVALGKGFMPGGDCKPGPLRWWSGGLRVDVHVRLTVWWNGLASCSGTRSLVNGWVKLGQ